jgi:hypothetical protein
MEMSRNKVRPLNRINQIILLNIFLIFISYPYNLFSFSLIDRNLLTDQNQLENSGSNILKDSEDVKTNSEYKSELSPSKALWLELVPLVLASSGAAIDQIIKGSTCYQKWIDTTIDGDKVRLKGEYKCDLTWEFWYPISLMFISIPGHFYVEDSAKKTGLIFLAKAISYGAITGITALSSIRDPDSGTDNNNNDFLIGLYFGSLTVVGIYIYEMVDVYYSAKIKNLEINKQQGFFIQPLVWKGEYRFNVGYQF